MRPLAVVAVAALCLAASAAVAEPLPTFDQIVERLNSVNPTLKTLIVEQTARVTLLGIFHFNLRTTVYAARPAFYKVVVHESPAFLRSLGDTFYMVSSPEQVLTDYQAASIRPGSEGTVVLELRAKRESVNPPRGRAVIDTLRWLVQQVTLDYQWGQVQARYHYGDIQGYLLPDVVNVFLSGFPVSAELIYTNYQLNATIDPEVFTQAPTPTPEPPP